MFWTVTLNPAIDYGLGVDGLRLGATNRAAWDGMTAGGKGLNVARVLRELGEPVKALALVGGSTGRALADLLAREDLDTDLLEVAGGNTRINVKVYENRRETEINGRGPEVSPAEWEALCGRLDGLAPGDTLVLAGSLPPGLGADAYARLARRAGKQVRVAVDAAGEVLRAALVEEPFLVKPNRQELGEFFREPVDGPEEVIRLGRRLRDLGARNVLISLGGQGAVLLAEDGKIRRRVAPKGPVVNTVGSGDAMVAAFLAAAGEDPDWDQALAAAVAWGSAGACSEGLPKKADALRLLEEMDR